MNTSMKTLTTLAIAAGVTLGAAGIFTGGTAHAHSASLEAQGATTIAAVRANVASGSAQARLNCAADPTCNDEIQNGGH